MPKPRTGAPLRGAVSIKKTAYAMASVDGSSAEITLYGDIYESQPTDWYGNPVEGQFILLDEFMEDLKQVENCKSITIRMNSYGGDAGVSNTIHNRLRELARDGADIICVVDGVAMSGGSLIMCACDTVRVNPSSLIMVHKGWNFLFGGYNADELRDLAKTLDAWDKMQVEIYKRKTGLTETVLLHLMSNTTYMTGREAKEKGFADEILEDAEPVGIAASADGRTLFVHGRQLHLTPGMFAPDNIPTVTPEAEAAVETNTNTPVVTGSEEGGNSMTVEELRVQYPDQIASVEAAARAAVDNTDAVNAAVQAERERIAGIDEVAALFDPAIVQEAKYGEKPCTAAEMTLKAAQTAAKKGSKFLADAKEDAEASGAAGVQSVPGKEDADEDADTPEARLNNARAQVKAVLGKKEG